ncbi:MAG: hypothetical protein ABIK31_05625, partial [candidate division WOR-3 bacterium]
TFFDAAFEAVGLFVVARLVDDFLGRATFFFKGLIFLISFFTGGLLLVDRLVAARFVAVDFFSSGCFIVAIVVS